MRETTFDESDCCGNGCANCVLDEKPKQILPSNLCGKPNIIEKYTEFILKSKRLHSNLSDILELHFVSCLEPIMKEEYILRIPSGHHVMMRAPIFVSENGKTKNLLRPYSPYYVDSTNLEFKILVNLKPKGPMSTYISNLEDGHRVEIRGPIGSLYIYEPASTIPKKLYIFSQGVALAPTLPIIEQILDNEDDITSINHFACFVDLEHVYFRKRLHEFGRYWNYNLRVYLSRQQCGNEECLKNLVCIDDCMNLKKKLFYKEKVFSRRLTKLELNEYCKTGDTRENVYVIAGARAFQNQITDMIKSLSIGIDEKNIFLL